VDEETIHFAKITASGKQALKSPPSLALAFSDLFHTDTSRLYV